VRYHSAVSGVPPSNSISFAWRACQDRCQCVMVNVRYCVMLSMYCTYLICDATAVSAGNRGDVRPRRENILRGGRGPHIYRDGGIISDGVQSGRNLSSLGRWLQLASMPRKFPTCIQAVATRQPELGHSTPPRCSIDPRWIGKREEKLSETREAPSSPS